MSPRLIRDAREVANERDGISVANCDVGVWHGGVGYLFVERM